MQVYVYICRREVQDKIWVNAIGKKIMGEGNLKRTKIRGCLRVPVWEIERYEKELEREMEEV